MVVPPPARGLLPHSARRRLQDGWVQLLIHAGERGASPSSQPRQWRRGTAALRRDAGGIQSGQAAECRKTAGMQVAPLQARSGRWTLVTDALKLNRPVTTRTLTHLQVFIRSAVPTARRPRRRSRTAGLARQNLTNIKGKTNTNSTDWWWTLLKLRYVLSRFKNRPYAAGVDSVIPCHIRSKFSGCVLRHADPDRNSFHSPASRRVSRGCASASARPNRQPTHSPRPPHITT